MVISSLDKLLSLELFKARSSYQKRREQDFRKWLHLPKFDTSQRKCCASQNIVVLNVGKTCNRMFELCEFFHAKLVPCSSMEL